MEVLKKERIGALMVIERDNSLNDYITRSKKIYADNRSVVCAYHNWLCHNTDEYGV